VSNLDALLRAAAAELDVAGDGGEGGAGGGGGGEVGGADAEGGGGGSGGGGGRGGDGVAVRTAPALRLAAGRLLGAREGRLKSPVHLADVLGTAKLANALLLALWAHAAALAALRAMDTAAAAELLAPAPMVLLNEPSLRALDAARELQIKAISPQEKDFFFGADIALLLGGVAGRVTVYLRLPRGGPFGALAPKAAAAPGGGQKRRLSRGRGGDGDDGYGDDGEEDEAGAAAAAAAAPPPPPPPPLPGGDAGEAEEVGAVTGETRLGVDAAAWAAAIPLAATAPFGRFAADPSRLAAELALQLRLSLHRRGLLGRAPLALFSKAWLGARRALAADLLPLVTAGLPGAPPAYADFMAAELAAFGTNLAFAEFQRHLLAPAQQMARVRGGGGGGGADGMRAENYRECVRRKRTAFLNYATD